MAVRTTIACNLGAQRLLARCVHRDHWGAGASQSQFLRLGFESYKKIMTNLKGVSDYLEQQLVRTGRFKILNDPVGLPLVAFSLRDRSKFNGA